MDQPKARLLDADALLAYALKALGGRAHSTGELREKLRRRAQRVSDVDDVLARLKENGYLDDRRYAETFANSRLSNDRFGPGRVLRDLRKRRVAPTLAERTVRQVYEDVDQQALIEILTEPKNAFVRQYQRMFQIDGVELEFERDALEAIADLAVLRQTGARGLRAILEEVLGPIMFDVPSNDDVARVVVTREAVLENAAPTIVPHAPRRAEKSA